VVGTYSIVGDSCLVSNMITSGSDGLRLAVLGVVAGTGVACAGGRDVVPPTAAVGNRGFMIIG
jgi:hypothetical protein